MKVGWIGLGKLGLPCALAMASKGHDVIGTDINPDVRGYIENKSIPYQEAGVKELFTAGYTVGWRNTINDVVSESEIVFVAVQTPHAPDYEGVTPVPEETKDFEYAFLESAVKSIADSTKWMLDRRPVIVIVSTVLPGTTERVLLPHLSRFDTPVVYSPCFIAMGTAVHDWLNPSIVLAGTDNRSALWKLEQAMKTLHSAPVLHMSIPSAEMTKVLYNTFISMKIVFANTCMELAEKVGGNCDDIAMALSLAKDRIISEKYMRGGMGDGGGCHPRDNIAMSYLAEKHKLSVDPFSFLMYARDQQTQWLGQMARHYADMTSLPIVICGPEYKAETNLTVGSPSRLLKYYLKDAFWDTNWNFDIAAVYVIGVNHRKYAGYTWQQRSIVLDPWGYINDRPGVTVVRIGRR